MPFDATGLVLRLPVILFSLTIHEFMHAWSAWKLGDDTALRAGRVTLNPLAHLDLLGTLMLIVGPIGWAKPVPVDRGNFRYETARRDDILVSGAGIAANFAVAAGLAVAARVLVLYGLVPEPPAPGEEMSLSGILWSMMGQAIFINFALAVFNLLPIHPLDGSHILKNLLPLNAAIRYSNLSRYGWVILVVVVLANRAMGFLVWPLFLLMLLFAGPGATGVILDHIW